jgi:hypothetical protein
MNDENKERQRKTKERKQEIEEGGKYVEAKKKRNAKKRWK